MASSKAFEWMCEALEEATSLDRLQARGTVRIALKQAGLDVATVTADQLAVVASKLLVDELRRRGIEGAEAVCANLRDRVGEVGEDSGTHDTPEAIFARLGG